MRYPDKSHSETGSRMWFPAVEGKGQWRVSVSWRVKLGEKEKILEIDGGDICTTMCM